MGLCKSPPKNIEHVFLMVLRKNILSGIAKKENYRAAIIERLKYLSRAYNKDASK